MGPRIYAEIALEASNTCVAARPLQPAPGMRATSYQGPGRLRVVDKPEPRIEHPNDAVLRVTRAAICGSDLHLFHGLIPDTRVGHTFGHEFRSEERRVGKE